MTPVQLGGLPSRVIRISTGISYQKYMERIRLLWSHAGRCIKTGESARAVMLVIPICDSIYVLYMIYHIDKLSETSSSGR